ncbi:MAG: Aminotransferase class III-fold pyridoxal phosphate-dependent enzyme [Candidatus Hydrogenedentes bacterium]|nr:Aminotransferase class III-fold pyridoxal phosphate-dependent enzyme [Candidatus Hydrogenedentota bacterium]
MNDEPLHRSEGDLNISPRRAAWAEANLDAETRRWLDEDER